MTNLIRPEREAPAAGTHRTPASRAWNVAAAGVLVLLVWQAVTVWQVRGGNWTSLFCTGGNFQRPPELQQSTYVFPGSFGYDGQFYRLVAHRPWVSPERLPYFDDSRHRYGRILVPALAHVFCFAGPHAIDRAYIAIVYLSLGAGVYFLSLWSSFHGRSAWWGLLFLLTPASLVSADRMVVDGTLCSLFAALLWLEARSAPPAARWLVLALAALTRETGLLLIAGSVIVKAIERHWRRMLLYASAAIPFLAWSAWVAAHTPRGTAINIAAKPVYGLLLRLLSARELPGSAPWIATVVHVLDVVSLAAVLGSTVLFLAWRRTWKTSETACAAGLFAILALALGNPAHLVDAVGYGRPISPLLLWLMAEAVRRGQYALALVPVAVSASIVTLLSPFVSAVARLAGL